MSEIKEKPITFSSLLVPAVLDGSKVQTRRIMKLQPPDASFSPVPLPTGKWAFERPAKRHLHIERYGDYFRSAYQVGDLLWLKETWNAVVVCNDERLPWSIADKEFKVRENVVEVFYKATTPDGGPWASPRFMPKWATRPERFEVTAVRAQRIQSISEQDAVSEGVERNCPGYWESCVGCRVLGECLAKNEYRHYLRSLDGFPATSAVESFSSLWDRVNGKGAWERNDWVFAYTFRKWEG